MVVVWLLPPPVAVMTMGKVPSFALLDSSMYMSVVPEPGAPMVAGEKMTVVPAPWPEAANEIALLNPPDTVVVTVAMP